MEPHYYINTNFHTINSSNLTSLSLKNSEHKKNISEIDWDIFSNNNNNNNDNIDINIDEKSVAENELSIENFDYYKSNHLEHETSLKVVNSTVPSTSNDIPSANFSNNVSSCKNLTILLTVLVSNQMLTC